MPKVTFLPENRVVEFELGDLPYADHGRPGSILDVALNFDVPLEHVCGGNCSCTTCHVVVIKGAENLSEMEEDEIDRLDMAAGAELRSRLGCQALVKGDVTVQPMN